MVFSELEESACGICLCGDNTMAWKGQTHALLLHTLGPAIPLPAYSEQQTGHHDVPRLSCLSLDVHWCQTACSPPLSEGQCC
jgi:hypothetical protein